MAGRRRRRVVRSRRCSVEALESRRMFAGAGPSAAAVPALLPQLHVSHFGQDISWVGSTGVHDIALTNPGSGYTSAPQVTISGAGTGATAHAVLDPGNGSVLGVLLDTPGTGYDATTTHVTITGGGGSGATASAQVYVTAKDMFRSWADDYIAFCTNNQVRCAYVNVGDYSIDKDNYYDYLDPNAEGAGGVPWIVTEFLDRLPQGVDAGVIAYLDPADPWTLYDPSNTPGNVTTTDGKAGSPAKNNVYQAFELVNVINQAQMNKGGTKYITHFQADGEGAGAFALDSYYGFGPVGKRGAAYDGTLNQPMPNPSWTTPSEWPVAGYGYIKWLWNHFMPGTTSAPADNHARNLSGPGVPDVVFSDTEACDPGTWSTGSSLPYQFGIIKYAQTSWLGFSPGPMVAYTENYWFGENHYLPGPGSAIAPDGTMTIGGDFVGFITPPAAVVTATFTTAPAVTFSQPKDAAGNPIGTAATAVALMGTGAVDTTAITNGNWVHQYFGGNGIGSGYGTGTLVVAGGSGYSKYDTVTFVPQGGDQPTRPAQGAIVADGSGKILGVSISDPGAGYKSEPKIQINSATGSGAQVEARILVEDGYPQVSFPAPPGPGGHAATAYLQVADESTKNPGAILGIVFVDAGAGYPRNPCTSFTDTGGIVGTISPPAPGGTAVPPLHVPVNSGPQNVAMILVTGLGDHYDTASNIPTYSIGSDPTAYHLTGGPAGNGVDPNYNGAYVAPLDLAGSFLEKAGISAVTVTLNGSGFSAGAVITSGGAGYDDSKSYLFPLPAPAGGGTAATARLVTSGGVATGVVIVDPGSGYGGSADDGVPFSYTPTGGASACAGTMFMGNFPIVAIDPTSERWMNGTGTSAKPYPIMRPASSPGQGYEVAAIGMTNRGLGYVVAPKVTATVPNAAAGDLPLVVTSIPVPASSFGVAAANRLPTIDTVLGPAPATATTIQGGANAYNWVLSNGYGPTQLAGFTITAPGSGYSSASPPAVTFSAPTIPGGRAAQGVATVVNGQVTGIVLTQIGYGYDPANPPTVTIAPPPGGGTAATATATVGDVEVVSLQAADTVYSHFAAQPALLAAMFNDPNYQDVDLPKLSTEFYWPLGWGDFTNPDRTDGGSVPQQAIPTFSLESLNRSNAFDAAGNYVPGVGRRTSLDSKYQTDGRLTTRNPLGGTFAGLSSLTYTEFVTFLNSVATIIATNASAGGHPMTPGDVTIQLYDVAFLPTEWVGVQNPNRWGTTAQAPVFHGGSTGTVAENTPASTVVYAAVTSTVSATAADAQVSYAIDAGYGDAGAVAIDSHSGEVRLRAPANYEAKSSYVFRIVASTGGAATLASTRDVTVTVGDVFEAPAAPSIDVPSRFAGAEDAALRIVFPAPPFADADSSVRKSMTVTLHVDAGRIDALPARGVTVGGTPRDRTFTGPLAALDAYFTDVVGRILYTPARDASGPQVLGIGIAEGYRGFRMQSRGEAMIDLAPVNDAPTLRVPSSFAVGEDVAGRLLWPAGFPAVADIDSPVLTLSLEVPSGALAATATAAVAVGGSPRILTLTGSPADLDRFLKTSGTVSFTPPADSTAPVRLTAILSDGIATATARTTIRVRPVNDAPTVTPTGFVLGAERDESVVIRHAALRSATRAADVDSTRVSFIVENVAAGYLARWNGRAWVAITPATPLAGRIVAVGTPLRWTPPAGQSGLVAAFDVRGWDGSLPSAATSRISVSIATDPPVSFAYFLDDTSQVDAVPAGYGVVGEFKPVVRATLAAAGRVVGESVALKQSPDTGFSLWPAIGPLFTPGTAVDPADYPTLARSILQAALVDDDEFLAPAEGTPTAAGGFAFWGQDFEFMPGKVPTDEVYAGVTAVLWAGRQILGNNVKILPVMSSSLFKTLGDPTQGPYSSLHIAQGVSSSTPYLASLNLKTLEPNPSAPDGEWNFLSFLQANGLIDGFFGQQYNLADPGHVTPDTKPFSDATLPYALVSAHDNPMQVATGQWTTVYHGNILFQSMVYWSAAVDPLWNQSKPRVLTPTIAPLPTAAFAGYGQAG